MVEKDLKYESRRLQFDRHCKSIKMHFPKFALLETTSQLASSIMHKVSKFKGNQFDNYYFMLVIQFGNRVIFFNNNSSL